MRAVVQRVKTASVRVEGETIGEIGAGLLVLLGIEKGDSAEDIGYICSKLAGLRIFEDPDGKMNLSMTEVGGSILLVSQFTLLGDCRKGRRPSFFAAMGPEEALPIYENCIAALKEQGIPVATGSFGAEMEVGLVNDGPVTVLLDSRRVF